MSLTHEGTADVLLASRHLGAEPEECPNPSVTIRLTEQGTPTIARLEVDGPLQWPGHANHVTVTLPNGREIKGVIVEINREAEGAHWLTFSLDD
ncbi:hypothetical protein G7025_03950 [Pseudomonas lurida]|jgi:hypothetical protein|uniref:Uncharacterized protein n=1 Tax=Pseudomonas quebecensis TaxID=2995174 RepID=A0ABY6QKR1_9PSED|nr:MULTISPECIES: hypothetical protein [Pseudomonas]MBA1292498.1 hypothetical protein [Pseudomonas lurida]MCX4065691.1 hypothetical protein [Pseudomonas quebecensis]UZW20590.1 hypothetical protein OSC50_09710 [Pseudomonas quebecensis]UZW21992.1 hypothetical protein OSC48_15770 [Pseudomonas quebecensis]UZW27052.1 hypothetical protein OSC49_15775 [Pseudomonas quebecensis]